MGKIENIVFDLGEVLIKWDPRNLYRRIFGTEEEVDFFLDRICTQKWNEKQDEGRNIQEGTKELVEKYPEYKMQIEAFYGRWVEMLGGLYEGTAAIIKSLKADDRYQLFALSNWSAETFPIAQARYPILSLFDGLVISGYEKVKKPNPKIYYILLERYQVKPDTCLFIDDSEKNVIAAQQIGFSTHHFISEAHLLKYLIKSEII